MPCDLFYHYHRLVDLTPKIGRAASGQIEEAAKLQIEVRKTLKTLINRCLMELK